MKFKGIIFKKRNGNEESPFYVGSNETTGNLYFQRVELSVWT